jgi:hypothetical protein
MTMHSELFNLWLFFLAIVKCAIMTGLGPGILVMYLLAFLACQRQVQLPVERKVIPFPPPRRGVVLVFPTRPSRVRNGRRGK